MTETHTPYQRGRRAAKAGHERSAPEDLKNWHEAMSWRCGYDSVVLSPETPVVADPVRAPAKGGLNDYWLLEVTHPQRKENAPYTAECDDLISALGLTFEEGRTFKAIWRRAMTRKGTGKPGVTALYDAEKAEHYGRRVAEMARREAAL